MRLTLVLGAVAAAAAGILAVTFQATSEKIEIQQKLVKQKALNDVFFKIDMAKASINELSDKVSLIYENGDQSRPPYYAALGAGLGYNKGVPIELLVGFEKKEKGGAEKFVVVGWKVIKSEETPGLGENAKNTEPPFTWAEKLSGSAKEAGPDRRTKFQKQFEGLSPEEMKARETIDVITAATYSTIGIIDAIKDAEVNLKSALEKNNIK